MRFYEHLGDEFWVSIVCLNFRNMVNRFLLFQYNSLYLFNIYVLFLKHYDYNNDKTVLVGKTKNYILNINKKC